MCVCRTFLYARRHQDALFSFGKKDFEKYDLPFMGMSDKKGKSKKKKGGQKFRR